MHGSSLTNYAKRNLLLPLDEALSVTDTDIEDAAPAAREAVTYDGKTYALPFDLHAALVHLNVDLFAQAGLVDEAGKPVMPTSTEEFLQHAEQMKAKTGKDYFGAARVKDGLGVHMWRSLVEQQGGSVLNEDGTKATVDTEEARTSLEFMDQVFGTYADPAQTYDAAQAAFLSGETAMLMNGTWVVDQYDKEATFDYQTADFPTLYEQPAIWADSHTWVVPRQKDADRPATARPSSSSATSTTTPGTGHPHRPPRRPHVGAREPGVRRGAAARQLRRHRHDERPAGAEHQQLAGRAGHADQADRLDLVPGELGRQGARGGRPPGGHGPRPVAAAGSPARRTP
jgi:hypothetical protein